MPAQKDKLTAKVTPLGERHVIEAVGVIGWLLKCFSVVS